MQGGATRAACMDGRRDPLNKCQVLLAVFQIQTSSYNTQTGVAQRSLKMSTQLRTVFAWLCRAALCCNVVFFGVFFFAAHGGTAPHPCQSETITRALFRPSVGSGTAATKWFCFPFFL